MAYRYEVEFSFSVEVDDSDCIEPTTFIHHVRGAIKQFAYDEGGHEDSIQVGQVYLRIIDLAAGINAGFNPFDVLDSFDQESYDDGSILVDEDGEMREEVVDQFPDLIWQYRIVTVNSITIEPEYRGRGIGLLALRKVLEVFGHSAFVLIKPYPLQFSGWHDASWVPPEGVHDPEREFGRARKKLVRYWKRLGAREIGKTGYLGIENTEELPSIKAVLDPTHSGKPRMRRRCSVPSRTPR